MRILPTTRALSLAAGCSPAPVACASAYLMTVASIKVNMLMSGTVPRHTATTLHPSGDTRAKWRIEWRLVKAASDTSSQNDVVWETYTHRHFSSPALGAADLTVGRRGREQRYVPKSEVAPGVFHRSQTFSRTAKHFNTEIRLSIGHPRTLAHASDTRNDVSSNPSTACNIPTIGQLDFLLCEGEVELVSLSAGSSK